jgi:cell division protein FtsN
LALLDQMGTQDRQAVKLTFHEALAANEKRGGPLAEEDLPSLSHNKGLALERTSSKKQQAKPDELSPAPSAEQQKNDETKRVTPAPKSARSPSRPSPNKQAEQGPPPSAGVKEGTGGKYCLQLSSFQDKREAELFMAKLKTEGMKPFIIASVIAGRGIWFRVRLGAFATWEEALTAKQDFEKKHNSIAYVAKF